MLNKILFGIVVAVVIAAVIYIPKAIRVYNVVHLFDEDKIVKNFMHMNKVFPSTPIKSSDTPHIFETSKRNRLLMQYLKDLQLSKT